MGENPFRELYEEALHGQTKVASDVFAPAPPADRPEEATDPSSAPYSGLFAPGSLEVVDGPDRILQDLVNRKWYVEALREADRLLHENPRDRDLHLWRAYIRCSVGKPDDLQALHEAERDLDAARPLGDDGFTRGVQGLVRCWAKDHKQAIEHLTVASENHCDAPDFRMCRGVVHYWLGEFRPAIADFDHAVREDPTIYPGYRYLAACHDALGELKGELADLEKASELWPKDNELRIARIEIAIQLGECDKALRDLDLLIADHPDYSHGVAIRGLVRWLAHKDSALVKADLDRAIEICPREWFFHAIRAAFDYKLGDYAHALSDATRCCLVMRRTEFKFWWRIQHTGNGHGRFGVGLYWRPEGSKKHEKKEGEPGDLDHKFTELGLKMLWAQACR